MPFHFGARPTIRNPRFALAPSSVSFIAANRSFAFTQNGEGPPAPLRANSGNFTLAAGACLANDLRAESLPDSAQPVPSAGYWYLVRPVNQCSGNGSYDDNAAPRDAEIAASGTACP